MAYAFVENQHLTDIANAIRSRTGSQGTMKVSQMSRNIANIPTGSNLAITDCSYLFCDNLRISQLNEILLYCTPLTTRYMFNGSTGISNLNLSGLDTSNTTDMAYMFQACQGLANLNLSGLNTSVVTNMSYMFRYCTSLASLDLSGFNISNVTNMNCMFNSCTNLETLDISSFDFGNLTDYSGIFVDCGKLTMSGQKTTVYVKDTTAQNWILNLSVDDRPSDWSTDNVIVKS